MFSKTSRPETETEQDIQAEPTPTDEQQADNVIAMPEQDELQTKFNQLQDQYTRLAADFDNFRKRAREEQESVAKYGSQKAIMELLPVLDNLDRAAGSLSETSDPETLFKSFRIVQKQLLDRMEVLGVKKIEAIGQEFNPEYHEAVNRMESLEFPENTVMYEAQNGYTLHGKVIRPAMVVVSMGNPAEQAEAATTSEDTASKNPFLQ